MERKKFLKLSMLLVVMVMMAFVKPEKVLATGSDLPIIEDTDKKGTLTITKKKEDTTKETATKEPIADVGYSLYKIASIKQVMDSDTGTVKLNYELISELASMDIMPDTSTTTDEKEILNIINTKAEDIYNVLTTTNVNPIKTDTTNAEGQIEFTGIEMGVYLVYESVRPAGVSKGQSFIISMPMINDSQNGWTYKIEATPKNEITDMTVEKSILISEGTEKNPTDDKLTKSESYAIGTEITYRIEAEIPNNVEDLLYYVIDDTPSAGLTISTNDIYVYTEKTVSGTTTYNALYSDGNTIDYNTITTASDATRIYFNTKSLTGCQKVYIQIKATLNEDAVIGTTSGNANDVTLRYSKTTSSTENPNSPQNPSDNTGLAEVTLDTADVPKVYTFGIDLTKKNESNKTLADVKFQLLGANGNAISFEEKTSDDGGKYYYPSSNGNIEIVTGIDGKLNIQGLSDGLYQLKETQTLSGYTLLKDPITINIKSTPGGTVEYLANNNGDYFKYDANTSYYAEADVKIDLAGFSVGDYVNWSGEVRNNANFSEDSVQKYIRYNGENSMTMSTNINSNATDGIINITVLNKKGFTLPSTGGRGIYIFTITGLLIMAGAVVLMVKNKKKSK